MSKQGRRFLVIFMFFLVLLAIANCAPKNKDLGTPVPATIVTDSDGDGVPDNRDNCLCTPKGVPVSNDGCWKLGDSSIVFKFDSHLLTKKGREIIKEKIAPVFRENPDLQAMIEGRTDKYGKAEINKPLSIARAVSVFNFL